MPLDDAEFFLEGIRERKKIKIERGQTSQPLSNLGNKKAQRKADKVFKRWKRVFSSEETRNKTLTEKRIQDCFVRKKAVYEITKQGGVK